MLVLRPWPLDEELSNLIDFGFKRVVSFTERVTNDLFDHLMLIRTGPKVLRCVKEINFINVIFEI